MQVARVDHSLCVVADRNPRPWREPAHDRRPLVGRVFRRRRRSDGHIAANFGNQKLALEDEALSDHPGLRSFEGRKVIVGIRPEDLEDASQTRDSAPNRRLRGRVELREALGSEIMVHMSVDAQHAQTEDVQELREDVGVPSGGEDGGEQRTTIVGRFTPRSRVAVGDDAEAVVDTRNLHFFDPETGLGIYGDQAKGASE
jgi:multiple sugar transport system ATP-binding protein